MIKSLFFLLLINLTALVKSKWIKTQTDLLPAAWDMSSPAAVWMTIWYNPRGREWESEKGYRPTSRSVDAVPVAPREVDHNKNTGASTRPLYGNICWRYTSSVLTVIIVYWYQAGWWWLVAALMLKSEYLVHPPIVMVMRSWRPMSDSVL